MNNILNVVDTIKPQVKYKGSVKVLYIDKRSGKAKTLRRHNSGGEGLFTAISRMLIGLDTAEFIPSYIMAYNAGGAQLFTQDIGYASTPVLYKSVTNGSGEVIGDAIAESAESADIVQYTFMIPANNLVSRQQKIVKIKLFNKKGKLCAELDLTDAAIDTAIGSNILIYWKLKFA